MAKKSKSSKQINHKNVLYVLGAVIVIVLLLTVVLKYSGKQLAGKATTVYTKDVAGKDTLPVTITFAQGETEAEFEYPTGKKYVLSFVIDSITKTITDLGIIAKPAVEGGAGAVCNPGDVCSSSTVKYGVCVNMKGTISCMACSVNPTDLNACPTGYICDTNVCIKKEPTSVCGDGQVETGEQCDDGDGNDNDGLNGGCREDCTLIACGDKIIDINAGESCDDGNIINNDGCNSKCLIETNDIPFADVDLRIDEVGAGDVIVNGITLEEIDICIENTGTETVKDNFKIYIESLNSDNEYIDDGIFNVDLTKINELCDAGTLFGSLEVDESTLPNINLKIIVDYNNDILETNEDNNEWTGAVVATQSLS